jgi:hypothetical protein
VFHHLADPTASVEELKIVLNVHVCQECSVLHQTADLSAQLIKIALLTVPASVKIAKIHALDLVVSTHFATSKTTNLSAAVLKATMAIPILAAM